MPACRKRARLGLTITHHHQGNQVGMVENRPIGVREAVPELSAFMNATGRFGSCMTANPTGKAELLEKALHSSDVFTLIRIDFGVSSFEISVGQDCGRAVPRS